MTLLENIATILAAIVPGFVFLGKWLDRKISSREKDTREFNSLLLWGIESIGGLTAANTFAIQNGKAGLEMEVALADYQGFRKHLGEFKNRQAAKSL